MADIFAILGRTALPRNSLTGPSIEDLQSHLRGLLETKVSPVRAERVSFTFDIASTARFNVALSQYENDELEGLGGIDPVLGGARPAPATNASDGANLIPRVIAANDTIMNQPQDKPTIQKVVAKHIIGSVGACDGSSWAVREVSRGAQGWTFTYACKDSMQTWRRQNPKDMQPVVVGDYSEKERDPVYSSRPAFDCGGTVVISFSRSSRNIAIKYKHTPFHKSVADLLDHFAPPPPPVAPPAASATPRSAKSSRKRDRPNGGGEGSSRKRPRTKKSDASAGVNAAGEAGNDDQNSAGASHPDGTPQSKPKRKRPPRSRKKKDKEAAAGEAGATAQGDSGEGGAVHTDPVVNVDAEEAARRREKASELLRGAGVDPDTLSADQFNIFANQSPTLQNESLTMLVEYGAERLRIVHPSKDHTAQNAASGQPASAAASAPTATETEASASTAATGARAPRPKRPKISRGRCINCRAQKGIKCGLEKPACQICIDNGVECTYPLEKTRPKKKKPDVDADAAEEADETSMVDAQQDGDDTQISNMDATAGSVEMNTETTQGQLLPVQYPDHDDRAPENDGQNDVPGEAFMDAEDHAVAEPAPNQTYPLPEPPQPEPIQHSEPPQPEPIKYSEPPQPEPMSYPEPVASPPPQQKSKSQGGRRSLPHARKNKGSRELPPVAHPPSPATPSWGTVNPSSLATSRPQAGHVFPTEQAPPVPTPKMHSHSHGYQDIQQVAALSSAAISHTPSPAAVGHPPISRAQAASLQQQARGSPYQAAAPVSNPRTKSRQGHRGQSRTPVQEVTSSRAPASAPPHQQPPAVPRQPTPSGGAPYQNNIRSATNLSTTKSPDTATYNAASSLTGLGNYGFGNLGSQNANDQGNSRIGYEPYSHHPVSGNQRYTSFDDNFNRTASQNVKMPTTSAQANSTGYSTTSTTSTASSSNSNSHWPSQGSGLSGNSSAAATGTYSHSSHAAAQSSQSHLNPPTLTHASHSSAYGQKSQQQAQQEYAAYNPRVQQSQSQRVAQQQVQQGQRPQQTQQQQQQQHGWYGFGSAAAAQQEDYRSTRGDAPYGGGPYSHHGSMNVAGHEGSYGGDTDALIDLLGSVHHRP